MELRKMGWNSEDWMQQAKDIRKGSLAGSCEHCSKHSGSVKGGGFLN